MRKIPTMFVRDKENMQFVFDQPHPDCGWVFEGEGEATRKYDGTCCKIAEGKLFKRREVKFGKITPNGFIEEQLDEITGKRIGWVLVDPESKEDKYHRAAHSEKPDGTYELLGPKIQGNSEKHKFYILQSHSDAEVFYECPRTFDGLREWLSKIDIEGIVFHHPDGRMAKIKKKDFGMKR